MASGRGDDLEAGHDGGPPGRDEGDPQAPAGGLASKEGRAAALAVAVGAPLEVVSPATLARRVLVEESAAAIGRTWAIGCRSTLRREGRPASGGWPGTIREARLLVGQALPTAIMQGRNTPAITEAERELAARAAYASARAEWLRHAEAETP